MSFLSTVFIIFIGFRFIIITINFFSKSFLIKTNNSFNEPVSILIPARNEENNIISLLTSINSQDYTDLEIIILDDGSTDRTFEISANFTIKKGKLRVIKGEPLPAGWLGKNFACHQLAIEAKGKYLLFLDADVTINSAVINSAIKQMKSRNIQLLSLFADQQTITKGEKLIVPLINYLLLSLLPIGLIYGAENPAFGVASGQFMLFDAKAYKKHQWHQLVKGQVVEDVAIMRKIKSAGLKGEALMAAGLISCRMYISYTEALNGFSKNFLIVFNNSITLFAGYLLLLICAPIFLLATFNFWLVASAFGMIILGRMMIGRLAGRKIIDEVMLHPLQIISLTFVFFRIVYHRLKGNAQWKGRMVKV